MNTSILYSFAAAALIPVGITSAIGRSTSDKPISMIQIVQQLETNGYGPFSELSMDDGNWEIEVYKDGQKRELHVDPRTAKVIADRMDD
ncbi:hypothetical protein K227x_07780 [Rubripirellula lacrimiformis]|uniref:PepSY domain-containing protein n=1 Tax=Rubripirellula lacrimiformis TaxID=1930273 RepID=A0A517N5J1_9BACT|nr:PepSY domain-containing protein [Rubripirellula lacrimiformis]QDT02402.1 hypothetical protein K227x_07780 [Rubripirellula lacrimiformis]